MNTPLTALIDRNGFGEWLNQNGLVGTGVEIGVLYGDYSRQLLRTWKGEHLVGIDPYMVQPSSVYRDGCNIPDIERVRDDIIKEFAREPRYRLILQKSMDAVGQFADGSLVMVYVDGNHSKESCGQDADAWWPKVKSGGVLAGHDFYIRRDQYQNCGVFDAIWDFAHKVGLRPHVTNCTSWWFVKP